jgi:hypothetical protein
LSAKRKYWLTFGKFAEGSSYRQPASFWSGKLRKLAELKPADFARLTLRCSRFGGARRGDQAANLPLDRNAPSANLRKVEKSALRKFAESMNVELRFADHTARNKHPTPRARGSLMPGAGDETAKRRQFKSFNLYPRRSNAFAELSALKEGSK